MNGVVIEDNIVVSGPKCKYSPSMCDKVIEKASQGGHIPAMMMSIGVRSKDTWYRWQRDYPEFKEAVEFAKIVNQAYMEEIGMMAILGNIKDFNSSTYALVMNNKFGDEYKRGASGAGPTEITFNTVNLTSSEISQKIAQKLEKLKGLGVDIGQQDND